MLEKKVAYITGSTRGIGWATACAFAERGATVILNGCSDEALLAARMQELKERFGIPVTGHLCDVSSHQAVASVYQAIFRAHGRLDVLVNNAGILQDALLGMIPVEQIERSLAVNLAGSLHNLQAAARLMGRHGCGSIINITSIVGVEGNVGQAVYASSKAGVIGLTKAAAKELAPKGIRVNAIAPGFIDTDMARQLPETIFHERVASIAMGRIGSPQDVANVALFLASDLAAYVTGQVIGVDGGMRL